MSGSSHHLTGWTGWSAGRQPEDGPADLGAPGSRLRVVPGADEVGLVDGPVDGQGVLDDPCPEAPVGYVDVVVWPVVHGGGQLHGRQHDRGDPATDRRPRHWTVDQDVAVAGREQL